MPSVSSAWWRALWEADSAVYRQAFFEVLVVGGISILPLALAAYGTYLFQVYVSTEPSKPASEIFWNAILGGQLFFYAMSFIAAVVWHSAQDLKEPFPLRIAFWCISFLLGMLCSFYFGISPGLPGASIPEISVGSALIYFFAALMYMLILAFRNVEPPDIQRSARESEESLTEKVRRRRGLS